MCNAGKTCSIQRSNPESRLRTVPNLIPTENIIIDTETTLEPGVYYVPQGLTITSDNVTLDGNGATLIGNNRLGRGVTVQGRNNVTIKNLNLRDYFHGIYAEDIDNLCVTNCQITSTAEVKANTAFLDIWLSAQQAYGGGILLVNVRNSQINDNDLQHQMNGLLLYDCDTVSVHDNNASYCSGFGIMLSNTQSSEFVGNFADYCSRWEPRGERTGHMGADAAGFLIVSGSSHNVFRRNYARLGGDGFFLAGLNPHYELKSCNANVFEENDASYSPNIGFEATFSADNVFKNNVADHCNYGFWLGFSANNVVESNRSHFCGQAGVAVENGYGFVLEANNFHSNRHGVLLWSKHLQGLIETVPDNDTSHSWTIESNTFTQNYKAIRIAADQDHGIRPFVPVGKPPYNHVIRHNIIRDNRVGIELSGTQLTVLENNLLDRNVEIDVRS